MSGVSVVAVAPSVLMLILGTIALTFFLFASSLRLWSSRTRITAEIGRCSHQAPTLSHIQPECPAKNYSCQLLPASASWHRLSPFSLIALSRGCLPIMGSKDCWPVLVRHLRWAAGTVVPTISTPPAVLFPSLFRFAIFSRS